MYRKAIMTGKALTNKRKKLGLSMIEFGKLTGYSRAQIWKMEKDVHPVSPRLLKILDLLQKQKD